MKACKDCLVRPKAPGRSRCYHCYHKNRNSVKHYNFFHSKMKVLCIDIETTPNLAYVWDIWNQNVAVSQLIDSTQMLCFAAKWLGEDEVMFYRGKDMVAAAWELLNEADVVIHFYGSKFDIPHLNREFILNGYGPPSPYKQIDLKQAAAKKFKFTSNKLQYISEILGLPGKVDHEGFELWVKCLAGVQEAWETMEEYNRRDVVLLEEVYECMLPWLPNHPHRHLYDGDGGCPSCGADESNLILAGHAYTKLSKFIQYKCESCNSYFRNSKRLGGVTMQESVL